MGQGEHECDNVTVRHSSPLRNGMTNVLHYRSLNGRSALCLLTHSSLPPLVLSSCVIMSSTKTVPEEEISADDDEREWVQSPTPVKFAGRVSSAI